MFERFTEQARDVVVQAQQESRELRHDHIGTEHLLLAMLADTDIAGRVLRAAGAERDLVRADIQRLVAPSGPKLGAEDAEALRTIGIDLDAVLERVEQSLGPDCWPPASGRRRRRWRRGTGGHRPFTPRAKKVLELALREAIRLKHRHIGTEHLLLGLVREGNGLAARVLTDAGIELDRLRDDTLAAVHRAA